MTAAKLKRRIVEQAQCKRPALESVSISISNLRKMELV